MKKFHFIGIKGSGMSALAQILFDLGHQVQGSDVETVYFTQKPLEERGIRILPFSEKNIEEGWTIIAGNAFKEGNAEIDACLSKDIPFIRYHEFLKTFMEAYTSVGVSGAHGKTSTTGLLSHVLKHITNTSYLIGDGTGYGEKNSSHFVFEACEYRRHFLAYHPTYAVITNVDFDHPDYFAGIEDVKEAFQSFSNQTTKKVMVCGEDKEAKSISFKTPVMYYGFDEQNELRASNIQTTEKGTDFQVTYMEESLGVFHIPLHGRHHVLNALSVIGICLEEQLSMNKVKEAFLTYEGVKRRFTETTLAGNVLIDDYAHHPTEIKATLESVRAKYPTKQVVAVFQPHTFTRTSAFLTEFAQSLQGADDAYLVDIFGSAREQKGSLTIHDLINLIPNGKYVSEESIDVLGKYENAVLVFMGAGDIQKIQKKYEEMKKTLA